MVGWKGEEGAAEVLAAHPTRGSWALELERIEAFSGMKRKAAWLLEAERNVANSSTTMATTEGLDDAITGAKSSRQVAPPVSGR